LRPLRQLAEHFVNYVVHVCSSTTTSRSSSSSGLTAACNGIAGVGEHPLPLLSFCRVLPRLCEGVAEHHVVFEHEEPLLAAAVQVSQRGVFLFADGFESGNVARCDAHLQRQRLTPLDRGRAVDNFRVEAGEEFAPHPLPPSHVVVHVDHVRAFDGGKGVANLHPKHVPRGEQQNQQPGKRTGDVLRVFNGHFRMADSEKPHRRRYNQDSNHNNPMIHSKACRHDITGALPLPSRLILSLVHG